MKTITIELYPYSELSASAKKKAREEWMELDPSPGWWHEHQASAKAAMDAYRAFLYRGIQHRNYLQELIDSSANASRTGYCADCILGDVLSKVTDEELHNGKLPSTDKIKAAYDSAWESECRYQRTRAAVEETLLSNGVFFFKTGELVPVTIEMLAV